MKSVFERYKDIADLDAGKFLQDFVDFTNNEYQQIINYYTKGGDLKGNVVKKLGDLLDKGKEIIDSFEKYKTKLSTYYDYWELLDQVEEVYNKLEVYKNSQKWFRSNKSLFYDNIYKKQYILNQGETLSSLADKLGYITPNDDWVDVAVDNDLSEDDYDNEGGAILSISYKNNLNFEITTVVSEITEEKAYGNDINRIITYVQDSDGNWDLDVLSNQDTIEQTIDIIFTLFQGGIPEFPSLGIPKNILGGNSFTFQYPVLLRNIGSVIAEDDAFRKYSVTDLRLKKGAVFMDIQFETVNGGVFSKQLTI